jgi:hypothetical protein
MKVVILGCFYYAENKEKSLNFVKRLMSEYDKEFDCKAILVQNSDMDLAVDDYVLNDNRVSVVCGSNSRWEFSAWNEAVEAVEINESDVVIVFNDTVLTHRFYTWLDFTLFTSKLNSSFGERFVLGEVNSSGKSLEVGGVEITEWVSTYLFAIDGMTLRGIGGFLVEEGEYISPDFKLINMSVSLKAHINKWIFPDDKKNGWYKSGSVGGLSVDFINKKINAIYCEKSLSARSVDFGAKLVSVYDGPIYGLYRKLMNKFYSMVSFRRFNNE